MRFRGVPKFQTFVLKTIIMKKAQKNQFVNKYLVGMSALLLIGLSACRHTGPTEVAEAQLDPGALIEKGKLLVTTLGCNDCHSPKILSEHGPIPDPERLLSGHNSAEPLPAYDSETARSYVLFNMNSTAVVGPWGTSFAANLTPHASGIGTWSEEQFIRAMREGKYKGLENSRQLLPPMPWPGYASLTDAELKAIFAYLKSLDPVENIVPYPIPPQG
jgi:hypothetical protein